jgi:DNA-directed RNA polymerase subunit omega
MKVIYPSLDELMKRVDSKYTLVITAAKRGRQIRDGSRPTLDCRSRKEVTIALHEIGAGNIEYERARDGIK